MKPTEYKKQFLDFVTSVWPDGPPNGEVAIRFELNGIAYSFKVDQQDVKDYLAVKNEVKIANKIKVGTKTKEHFTAKDKEWLKKMKIVVTDGDEN